MTREENSCLVTHPPKNRFRKESPSLLKASLWPPEENGTAEIRGTTSYRNLAARPVAGVASIPFGDRGPTASVSYDILRASRHNSRSTPQVRAMPVLPGGRGRTSK